jgi:hypothetical protein
MLVSLRLFEGFLDMTVRGQQIEPTVQIIIEEEYAESE